MKLVDNRFRPGTARIKNGIAQCGGINNLARFAYVVRLEVRGGIRDNEVAIDPKLVARVPG